MKFQIIQIKNTTFIMIVVVLAVTVFLTGCNNKMSNSTLINDADVMQAKALINSNQSQLNISNAVWKKMLTSQQYNVLREEGTEYPFTGELLHNDKTGLYVTAGCGEPVFLSNTKFDSGTGWPSFYKPVSNENVLQIEDDSLGIKRTEVVGSRCHEHLGHVFDDGPAPTGLRYCINSAALKFIPYEKLDAEGYGDYKKYFNFEIATLAGGCFWGVEKLLENISGVISVTSGYTGGTTQNPTYEQVSSGDTGHAEAVEIIFDPKIITFESLLDVFWRLHDPTQIDRQGPDVGTNYRSAIFYHSEDQRLIAEKSKAEFDAKKIFSKPAATQIVPAGKFWPAEEYHQDYYDKHPGLTCHALRAK